MTRSSTKLGVSVRICDSPSVKELLASTLSSYGNNTMRERGVDIAILGVDIAVLGVDIAFLGVDIANLRRREKKGGATGRGGRGRFAVQDALKRVGSPVSLKAPRAARGVERRVLRRGPSRGRSGSSQRLCRSKGGGDRGSGRGQGLRRSGDDKSREVGRSRGLLSNGDDKRRGVGRSRGLLGSGGDKRRVVG